MLEQASVPEAEVDRLLVYGGASGWEPSGSGDGVEQAMMLLQAADAVEDRDALMRNVWADVEYAQGEVGNAELVSRLEMQLAGQLVRTAEGRLKARRDLGAKDGLFGSNPAPPEPRPPARPAKAPPPGAPPPPGQDGFFQVVLRESDEVAGLARELPAEELTATLATPRNLGAALDLVGAYLKNYEIDKADLVLERVVPLCREKGGTWLVKALDKLCAVRMKQFRAQETLVALKEIEQLCPFAPEEGWEFHDILYRNFAWCYSALDEAEKCLDYTMKSAEVKRACGIPSTWFDIWDLGKSHARMGQKADQRDEMRIGYDLCLKAGEIHRKAEQNDRIMLAKILSNAGEVAMGIGDSHYMSGETTEATRWYEEAEAPLREAYELHCECLGPMKPLSGWAAGTVAHCMVRLERWKDARDYLAIALKVECTKDSTTPGSVIELIDRVFGVHTELGDHRGLAAYVSDVESCLSSLRSRGWDRRERDVFAMLLQKVATVYLVADVGMMPKALRVLREAETNLEIFVQAAKSTGSCDPEYAEDEPRTDAGQSDVNAQEGPFDVEDLPPKQFGPRPEDPVDLLRQVRSSVQVLELGERAAAATAIGELGAAEDRMGVPAADATAFGGGWAEPDYVALGRSYALVGNWSKWQRFDELRMQLVDGRSIFVAEVPVPGNDDVEFQVICDGDWNLRIFPAVGGTGAGGGRVLGPAPGGHGHNWRLRGLRQPAAGAVLHVRLDPVGERSLQCRLEQAAAPQVAAGCA